MSDLFWTNTAVRLGDLKPWARNPKTISKRNAERLLASWDEMGQFQTVAIGPDGAVYDGHQRLSVLLAARGPEYMIDARQSNRALTEDERAKLVLTAHVGTTGAWDWSELAAWDETLLQDCGFDAALLKELNDDAANLSEMLKSIAAFDTELDQNAKPNPRQLPIDVIFCWGGGDNTCCLAVRGGWKYGVRSGDVQRDGIGICPIVPNSPRHAVAFVDNDFHNYDHGHHLDIVRLTRPKYATVRDVMTRDQCAKEGIEFYELDRILDWAEELSEWAENVIVIPKWDCLDRIPEKFMLGYSVPTKYGGTPLPAELFTGRRVHLLGGSWKAQLAHMALLGNDVVSLDNNHINIIASQFGQFIDPDGNAKQMQDVGFNYLPNVRDAAFVLSVGAIGAKVNELYAGSMTADPPDPKARQSRNLPNQKQGAIEDGTSSRGYRVLHRRTNDGGYCQSADRPVPGDEYRRRDVRLPADLHPAGLGA